MCMTNYNPERNEILAERIESLKIDGNTTISSLVEQFKDISFQARNIGHCSDIYRRMLTDMQRPTIFLGLSGALIAGGLRNILCDMLKNNMVDAIVTTGAVIYQDFYQARGYGHYKGNPNAEDDILYRLSIDRIYDTYVDEEKFRETDRFIGELVKDLEPRAYSTREFIGILGNTVKDENSILHTASRLKIPIFCPAIADSSIGIGLTLFHHREHEKQSHFHLDTIKDNHEIARLVAASGKTGAIYLGGGVPKNYINDSIVIADMIFGDQRGHDYAIQLTMDRAEWGGLSGSTLGEAQSWGKIYLEANKATAYIELTIGLPLLYSSVVGHSGRSARKRLNLDWTREMPIVD